MPLVQGIPGRARRDVRTHRLARASNTYAAIACMRRGRGSSRLRQHAFGALLLALLTPAHVSLARDAVETSGDLARIAIPAAAFAMTVKREDERGRIGFYKSFAANVGTTFALKSLVDKRRPDGSDDDAFPSGHTSVAFHGAAFLHRRYGMDDAWAAYGLAAYVGWTRLEADKHDAADVAAGAAVGIASAFLLNRRRTSDASFVPILGSDVAGVRFSMRF